MGPSGTSTCKGCQALTIVEYKGLCGRCLDKAMDAADLKKSRTPRDIYEHLGSTRIYIIQVLIILGRTGGSITCNPGEHRRWTVKNHDRSCESVDLTRACKSFYEDWVECGDDT